MGDYSGFKFELSEPESGIPTFSFRNGDGKVVRVSSWMLTQIAGGGSFMSMYGVNRLLKSRTVPLLVRAPLLFVVAPVSFSAIASLIVTRDIGTTAFVTGSTLLRSAIICANSPFMVYSTIGSNYLGLPKLEYHMSMNGLGVKFGNVTSSSLENPGADKSFWWPADE